MAFVRHLKSPPLSNGHGDSHSSQHETNGSPDVDADEYAPMDDPELFMNARERRQLAMQRAARARDAKLKS